MKDESRFSGCRAAQPALNAVKGQCALLILLSVFLTACNRTPGPAKPPSGELPLATRADSVLWGKEYTDAAYHVYGTGDLDSARVLFHLAIAFDSTHAPAWQGLGSTYGRLRQHEEAQAAFHQAIQLKPNYVSAWWHKGCDNAVAWKIEEALADLAQAIAIDSSVKAWPAQDSCWFGLLDDPRLVELTK